MLNIPCLGLVPMTKTILLGTIVAATLAIALVSAPGIDAYIASTLGLDDAKVKSNSKKLLAAKYYANGTFTTNNLADNSMTSE